MKNVYSKMQRKVLSYMLFDYFKRVSYETTIKHNSLLKIIYINFKLMVQSTTENVCISVKKLQF